MYYFNRMIDRYGIHIYRYTARKTQKHHQKSKEGFPFRFAQNLPQSHPTTPQAQALPITDTATAQCRSLSNPSASCWCYFHVISGDLQCPVLRTLLDWNLRNFRRQLVKAIRLMSRTFFWWNVGLEMIRMDRMLLKQPCEPAETLLSSTQSPSKRLYQEVTTL